LSVLEEAFRERLLRLAPQDPLVLAVSGGGDSVALAHLVRRAGRRAVVAHLDHALRPDSGEDFLFVRDLAQRLGFPFYGERVEVGRIARERGKNLEALAREVRYAFLHRVAKEVGAKAILTAHTLDDQAETVLLKLLQGTARGLGIREKEGMVVRPLLPFTREALRAYLLGLGEAWREDPTNRDLSLDRNYLRLSVLPLILERFPRAREALARFAQAREEEEAFLEGVAEVRLLPDPRFFVPAFRALPLLKAPEAVRRRALRRVLEALDLRPEARLIALLEEALKGRAGTLPGGYLARRYLGTLFLIPPSPRSPSPRASAGPFPGTTWKGPLAGNAWRPFWRKRVCPRSSGPSGPCGGRRGGWRRSWASFPLRKRRASWGSPWRRPGRPSPKGRCRWERSWSWRGRSTGSGTGWRPWKTPPPTPRCSSCGSWGKGPGEGGFT
jgi:tRNA(Ile)-lysidine synthase